MQMDEVCGRLDVIWQTVAYGGGDDQDHGGPCNTPAPHHPDLHRLLGAQAPGLTLMDQFAAAPRIWLWFEIIPHPLP